MGSWIFDAGRALEWECRTDGRKEIASMICKGCGRESAAGEEMKMVAQWPFCSECFQKLMAKGASKEYGGTSEEERAAFDGEESFSAGDPARARPSGEEETGEQRCEICGVPLSQDVCRVGTWRFCGDCFKDLVMSPSLRGTQDLPEETEGGEGAEGEASPEEDPGVAARVQIGFLRSVSCAGCGRRIPLGGAREVEGRPFCPDCFAKLPKEKQQGEEGLAQMVSAPGLPVEEPDGSDGGKSGECCESCGRTLPRERLKSVEGFVICSACLAADPALALDIARSRHKKKLQDIRDGLGRI